MLSTRTLKWALALVLMLLFVFLTGQDRSKNIALKPVAAPPRIDGRLDDACWKEMQPVTGFVQYDPVNGVPATEETLAWAAFDEKNIYFAFFMKDSQPKKIWAELTPRNEYENNDSISVILDTYNDHRTSISFTVNAKNVQQNSVETIWKSGAVVTEEGWTAEIAIPFKSLRFSTDPSQVWGVNFQRYIYRTNETDYWTAVIRDRPLLQQMGEISGLSGIRRGKNLEFFPYLGVRSTRWDGEKDDKVAGGLDFKYGILSNLVLDLTASPDFSEVESDPFIYQRSPYENYLWEMRPFFNEGSRYFSLATEGGDMYHGADYMLFYSRRIDNPKIAAKLTGKSGGFSFGVLGALNDEEEGQSAFSVVRVQKDVFTNSQVGFYYTGYDAKDDHNHNLAIDYNFNLKDIYFIRGASILTFNPETGNRAKGLHFFELEREVDNGWNWDVKYSYIEKDASIRTGFLSRTDVQRVGTETGYSWRFNKGPAKKFEFSFDTSNEYDCGLDYVGQSFHLGGWLEFKNMLELDVGLGLGRSRYQVMGEAGGLSWTPDFIHTSSYNCGVRWERGGLFKELGVHLGQESGGIYNESFSAVEAGKRLYLESELSLRPLSNFEIGLGAELVRETLDRTGEEVFSGITYSGSLHYQFTPSLFLATSLKGETREDQYNLDVLLGYYFGAGNIVQLAYKKMTRSEEGVREGGYSITLKISYLLRI